MKGLQCFKAPLMRPAWGVTWNIKNHLQMFIAYIIHSFICVGLPVLWKGTEVAAGQLWDHEDSGFLVLAVGWWWKTQYCEGELGCIYLS